MAGGHGSRIAIRPGLRNTIGNSVTFFPNKNAGNRPDGFDHVTVPWWMGHASLEVTAIYANALGAEEQGIAARMWG